MGFVNEKITGNRKSYALTGKGIKIISAYLNLIHETDPESPLGQPTTMLPFSGSKRKFHISIEKDETGLYVGRCKELPGAFTQAKTVSALKLRMAEVISLILEDIEEEHAKNPKKIIEVIV